MYLYTKFHRHTVFHDGISAFFRSQTPPSLHLARKVLSSRFLYYSSLVEKRYLAIWMWLCECNLKVKTAPFRLPSASQKRACLSSANNYSQGLGCTIQTILSYGIFTTLVPCEKIQFWFTFLPSWRFSSQNGGLYATAQRSPWFFVI